MPSDHGRVNYTARQPMKSRAAMSGEQAGRKSKCRNSRKWRLYAGASNEAFVGHRLTGVIRRFAQLRWPIPDDLEQLHPGLAAGPARTPASCARCSAAPSTCCWASTPARCSSTSACRARCAGCLRGRADAGARPRRLRLRRAGPALQRSASLRRRAVVRRDARRHRRLARAAAPARRRAVQRCLHRPADVRGHAPAQGVDQAGAAVRRDRRGRRQHLRVAKASFAPASGRPRPPAASAGRATSASPRPSADP